MARVNLINKLNKKALIVGISALLISGGVLMGRGNAHAQTTVQQNAPQTEQVQKQGTQRTTTPENNQQVSNQQVNQEHQEYNGNVPKWKQVGTAGYTLALQQHEQQLKNEQAKRAQGNQNAPVANQNTANRANNAQPTQKKTVQRASLPQTHEIGNHAGLIATAVITLGSILGIASLKKRKSEN